ncbi:MAG TPA: adenosine deaminase, partial [Bryobacteraceae bacterium]|nr:adenosine deaminase [Bryobacteraceae bacterium]
MSFAELHLHLEGTVDRETIRMLDPLAGRDEIERVWAFTDFAGFLECFKFVARRLRGPADYALVTRRMMQALHRQSISYAEVTIGAGVVQWLGYDFDSVWREIRAAQNDAYGQWPVEIRWNLDAIRQLGPDHVMEIAKLTARYVGDGVVSFGIGGDEQRGPAHEFRKAYRYAKDAGLRLTAHAGETDGPESVRNALDIGAERIGHGIRAIEDADLCRRLRDERIALEVCITSNVRTGAVASLGAHPIRRLVDAGVIVTLNTDDPGMFGSDLAGEFRLAKEVFGLDERELGVIRQNAFDYRF